MTAPTSDAILDRMMALHPKIIDLTLDRVWRLLAAIDNPQDKLPPVIHIAGTNGKGSTQAMIRAGLEGAGLTVHAYTSPHLARFHERIRLAGELISEADLTAVLDECYAANGGEDITYFEITTCAALLAFARAKADYTLARGRAGRTAGRNQRDQKTLAATVITPISIRPRTIPRRHACQDRRRKGGHYQTGRALHRWPSTEDEAMAVIERTAAKLGAPLIAHGQHWHVHEERGRLVYQDETGLLDLPLPNLLGAHQIQNAGSALTVLRHLNLGDAAYEASVTTAEWPARMQRLKTGPLVRSACHRCELWLDGGHNPAAGRCHRRDALAKLAQAAHPSDLRHAEHQGCDRLSGPSGHAGPKPDRRLNTR